MYTCLKARRKEGKMYTISNSPCIIRESSRGYDMIRIEDELLQSREIFLTGDVDAESMQSVIKQLIYLYRDDPEKEITVYINSPGGEVQSGLAVFDIMKMIPNPIRTVCIGTAASMGAILFLAGDRRVMMPHAQIMIHDPAPGSGSMEGMKPDEMEERLSDLKKCQKVTVEIISQATGRSEEDVRNKTKKDSFFNADEAISFGLATEIMTELR